jgi:hypothetical protein
MTKELDKEATDKAIEEFLANGGVIQQLRPNQSGRVEGQGYSWGKKPTVSPLANPPEED